jgi:hypothetical protein
MVKGLKVNIFGIGFLDQGAGFRMRELETKIYSFYF